MASVQPAAAEQADEPERAPADEPEPTDLTDPASDAQVPPTTRDEGAGAGSAEAHADAC
jgi:hypothetical protein